MSNATPCCQGVVIPVGEQCPRCGADGPDPPPFTDLGNRADNNSDTGIPLTIAIVAVIALWCWLHGSIT